jgi:hypothetical protein
MTNGILAVWIALSIVFGLIVGAAAGALSWIDGSSPAAAILVGGGSFAGATAFVLAIILLFRHGSAAGSPRN